ncbi:MAG: DoxX family protein [Chloroflexota bacterium]|nr:DoxX family protein [Chloroflexota bacterium]
MNATHVNHLYRPPSRFETRALGWLSRHCLLWLRVSLGLVFLGFGLLKFVPGLSPAQDLVRLTVEALTFGLVPGGVGLVLVAAMETAIGVSLVSGWHLRAGLVLLGLAMVGILSPVVLFPERLFAGPLSAPTLEGQYVLKDLVLLAAALVVAVAEFGRRQVGTGKEVRHGV